mgnify:FL=1
MITKTDFIFFLKAPLHLWAKVNDKLNKKAPSIYEQHLMKQGYEVEKLAHELLPNATWQKPYFTDDFEIRQDALIKYPDGNGHLYEIKSSTEVKKEHLFDVTFQSIITEEETKLKKIFVVTLNKEYVLNGELDINSLFIVKDVTKIVKKLKSTVEDLMYQAINVVNTEKPEKIEGCLNPKTCPCPDLCHPNLPEKSIFNVPYLSHKRKRELIDSKIININDISDELPLNPMQRKIVNAIKTNKPYLDKIKLKNFLDSFVYPIYFLDYETYPLAVPIYNKYKTYQQMVFQYSLHIVNKDGTILHKEYLETEQGDPSRNLIKQLSSDIGPVGSVISWNKTFEMGRNEDMARLYPEHSEFLKDVNKRMIDLADFINKEMYIHPDFLGSWSIKNVLPVMVPELSYKKLKINKGDQAMLTWWDMVNSKEKKQAKDLLEYCALDTLAMVKIWEKLKTLI